MWARRELKEWAKTALSRNYWKIVLVSVILMLLGCGAGGISFQKTIYQSSTESNADESNMAMDRMVGIRDISGNYFRAHSMGNSLGENIVVGLVATVIFLVIFLVVFGVILAVDIFLINPLTVGGNRFMIKSMEGVAQVKEIVFGFDHSYKNIVKTLFFKDLYIFLWSLLLIIPGIVKSYQYYMVPYLLTEYPDMDYKTALHTSRDMMEGQKWKTFVLELSFILWHILGAFTLGIVEVFYVQPYQNLTFAALYCKLRNQPIPQEQTGYGQYDPNDQYNPNGQYDQNAQYGPNGPYDANGNGNGQQW